MFSEFKTFIARGNVLDLAVGVIIGAAFGKIVASLTDDLIMPVIGWLTGGVDFSSKFVTLGALPAGYTGSPTDYAALKEAGVAMLGYGAFVTAIINFLILAFIIFMLVKYANKVLRPAEAPAGPTEADLLVEIRDELRKR
jgi:large conductance mechanosensitive channel